MLLRDAQIFARALQTNHSSQTHLIELKSLALSSLITSILT